MARSKKKKKKNRLNKRFETRLKNTDWRRKLIENTEQLFKVWRIAYKSTDYCITCIEET